MKGTLELVFADTAVALHVSYLIESLPTLESCSLRRALIAIMESIDLMNRQQSDWLRRLIGTPSSSVNFAGLTRLEIHGQCALVIDAVNARLPDPELFAMLARFAQTRPEKSAGVYGLVEYVYPSSPTGNHAALTDLVWRRYLPHQYRGGFSFRDIAKRSQVSKSTLARTADWLDGECDGLELRALRRLEETFVPHHVCAALPMRDTFARTTAN
jgi:hypothetical protein